MFKRVSVSVATTCVLSAALLVFGTIASAQGGLPPLIDREIFFGNPEIAGAQISPDGNISHFGSLTKTR